MTSYVLGFCFSVSPGSLPSENYVALIRKKRPEWQAGKLNGIGGKIEPGESARAAMSREFREETGTVDDEEAWCHFADLQFHDCRVYSFVGGMEMEKFLALGSPTDEEVIRVRVDRLVDFNPIPNLLWLVPMARAYLRNQTMPRLVIQETNIPAVFEEGTP